MDARSLKVLVVDDRHEMRGLARQCLKKLGINKVYVAANGDAGFDALRTQPFDMVISEFYLPKGDGIDFVTRVKSDPSLKSMPILVTTSPEEGDDTISHIPIEHIVAKPYSFADLRAALEKQFGQLT